MEENLINQAVHGFVGTDPALTTTANGTSRLSFRLGIPRRVETAEGEWVNTDPHFVTIAMYGRSAERTAAAVQKGDQVIALGNLREYEVTDEELGPRVMTEFRASRVGHDLNLSQVEVTRRSVAREASVTADAPIAEKVDYKAPNADTAAPQESSTTGPSGQSTAAQVWTQAAQRVGHAPPPPPTAQSPVIGF